MARVLVACAVIVVETAAFGVASLVLGVVELREAVGDLAPGHEELEAVGEEGILVVGARQRAHLGRIGVHKGGIHEGVLGELLEELDLQLAGAISRLERDAVLRALLA